MSATPSDPLARQGLRHGRHPLPGLRHRPQHHDIQHRRRRAAEAVSLRRPRPDPRPRHANQRRRRGRAVVPRHARLEGGHPAFTTIAASLGAPDDRGRRRRARALSRARDFLGPVSRCSAHRRSSAADFTAEDDRPNAAGVVLLGQQVWTTRYQADPTVSAAACSSTAGRTPSSA